MSENRRTQNSKRSQKSIIGNTTPLHHEEEETILTNKGTANEVEVVDPDIMEDTDAEVCQDSTDEKSNQSLDNQTSRFVKSDILPCKCRRKTEKYIKIQGVKLLDETTGIGLVHHHFLTPISA